MNICVFCSSSTSTPKVYGNAAAELGKQIATRGHTLIFGGGNVGLMREVAHNSQQLGGKICGVIPEYLRSREKRFEDADELIVTRTITERKTIMMDRADAFIVLPGGFGTLEEFIEITAAKFRDGDKRPIAILNTAGFYNQLFGFLDFLSHETLIDRNWRSAFFIYEDTTELLESLEKHAHLKSGVQKWHMY